MGKKVQMTKAAILRAAAEVVRKGNKLNVRAIAEELGCSTQPVYSQFQNMEELKETLLEEAKARYRDYIEEFLAKAGRSRYECFGMGFVKFAHEERGLFSYLFMRSGRGELKDPFLDDILSEMMTLYHMTESEARAFHGDMAVYSYGLAVLINLGNLHLSDEEISECLKREFYGLYDYYFPNRPRLG